jgi:hypothetical protein
MNTASEKEQQPCTIAGVSEMFYVMVDDKKILSVHRTEKGANDRKKEWEDSQFEGAFSVHRIELED